MALSSQDTGSNAKANRDEAITQALLLGGLLGLPLSMFGLVFSQTAIGLLGAEYGVIQSDAAYLKIIMFVAPASIVTLVGARAIQGTGDTRTAMFVNGFANILNILGSITLAFGLGPFPELSIVGIAIASATSDVGAACYTLA
ncbi:MATE family efflux transporter [Halostagnicola sp. A-GB9-2]|nr:MATE family efflux transporter [Halostagnicola sp. A-GB9-2]MDJ1433819.1 MATE family efflux transporter [Halostagnicola sp. A-GB9-2]